jgi:FKBP-type peptidyl-prolyl cis-trans isomerase FklB
MKKILFSLLCFSSVSVVLADAPAPLANENARVSYAVGMMLGHQWQQQGLGFDPDTVIRGVKDIQSGGATLLTQEQMQEILTNFRKDFSAKQAEKQAEQGVKNKADGEAFLAANKKNPGVTTLPDGLQYLVLTNGHGALPGPNDIVTVHYRGTLTDGTEFDSSYKRGQPAQFQVGGVIRGWTEALQKMSTGAKWKLFIPSDLAYGEAGHPPVIPPNSTLIFEVELLDAKSPAPAVETAPVAPLTSDIIKVPSAEEMKKGAKIEVIKPEDAAKAQKNAK